MPGKFFLRLLLALPLLPLAVSAQVLQSISVTPANPSVVVGLTEQFDALGTFSDGSTQDITTTATWTTSTSTRATITATGLATVVSPGTVTITATSGNISGSTVLTGIPPTLLAIQVTPTQAFLIAGQTQQYTATAIFNNGQSSVIPSPTWASSSPANATISSTGLATAAALGTTTITATQGNITSTSSGTLTVTPAGFVLTGSMNTPRQYHTATLLLNGKVLIAGGFDTANPTAGLTSAELYDPATGTFSLTGSLNVARFLDTATLLNNGKVLIAGGDETFSGSAELYDPSTGQFTPTGTMNTPRFFSTATLLKNGKVLFIGGEDNTGSATTSAELYDPATGQFTATGSLNTPREFQSATLLNNGQVLVAGGLNTVTSTPLATAELYNPATGTFSFTGSLNSPAEFTEATLLNSGKVVFGGTATTIEIYDPATGTFTNSANIGGFLNGFVTNTAPLLNNGTVLVVGSLLSSGVGFFSSAVLYDPVSDTINNTGDLNVARFANTTTLLLTGKVLVAGGVAFLPDGTEGATLTSAEIYTPSSLTPANLISIAVTPANSTVPVGSTQTFLATGTFVGGITQALQSVNWASSNGAVASITNGAAVGGVALGLTTGSTTITACAGAACGSTALTVGSGGPPTLVSIVISPINPSVMKGSTQQFSATGVFSDASTKNLTTSVTWNSATPATATITAAGLATAVNTGTSVISATSGNIFGTTTLTVVPLTDTLTVTFAGTGGGKVVDNASLLNCAGNPCSAAYSPNQVVVLTATPNTGSTFTGWSGACSGTGTCTVTMSSAKSVTANFFSNAAAACGPNDVVWVGGAAGNWNVPGNWSTNAVPGGGINVCINNNKTPASAVTLNVSESIGNLTINPGNSLTIADNISLVVSGTIANSGQIILAPTTDNTFLTLSGGVILTGGGTLTLNRTGNGQPILNNANAGTLTNVNNLIQGAGQIGNNGLVVTNLAAGTFNANNASFPLQLNSNGVTNLGILEASASGTLQIATNVVNKGGNIRTVTSTSTVALQGGLLIQGGTVTNTVGGTLGTVSGNSATLDGATQGVLTIAGVFTDADNATTLLVGTINNTGTIQVQAVTNNTFLVMNGTVTLNGGGTVNMNRGGASGTPVINNANNGVLNNVNNLIQGAGQIGNNGLVVTNQAAGVINANSASFPLLLNSNGITNLGLLEATGAATLQIVTTVVNQGANILAANTGSTVQLSSATIQGGTVTNSAGGTLGTSSGSATLDGSSHGVMNIVGIYTCADNTSTVFSGTVNNTGTVKILAAGDNTFLTMNGTVTLTGAGTVLLSRTSNGTPVINNANAGNLNNLNNLLQGAGQIGNNGLVFTNQAAGVVNANNPSFPLLINSNGATNLGVFEATAGGTLQIATTVLNKGANIQVTNANSFVQLLSGSEIRGGTLTNSAGVFETASGGVTLDGSSQGAMTLVGNYSCLDNTTTVFLGTINNTGIVSILAASDNTFLVMNGPVTLTGGGTVVLSQTAGGVPVINNANAGSLNNLNNLLQGAGQIGNNGLLFTNQVAGVVNANNSSAPLIINSNGAVNLGLFEATGKGTLQIATTVINRGANIKVANGGATLHLNSSDIQGGTLTNVGGTMDNPGGAILDGVTQGPLTIAGTFSALDNTSTVFVGTINNTGTVQILAATDNTFLTMNGTVTLTGGGTVNLSRTGNGLPIINNANNGALVNVNNFIEGAGQIGNNGLLLTNQAAGVISANSAFPLLLNSASVNNAGLILADGSPNPGFFGVSNYTQTATGGFAVVIGGTTAGTQYSQWNATGNTVLAGSLDVQLANGFVPAAGNQFTVLTGQGITGQFAKINSPSLRAGLSWSATYSATSVILSAVAGTGSGSATLTVTDLGVGSGTVTDDLGLINCTTTAGVISGTCSASYTSNSLVVLTATPVTGTTFGGWSTCAGTTPCSVTMNGNQSVNANFVPIGSSFNVTITAVGTGNGTVTDNLGEINCATSAGVQSGACSGSYAGGSVVTLTATPTGTSTFAGFGSPCTGSSPCSLTVAGPETVTASFAPAPQMVNLTFVPGNNATGMATYNCPSNPNPSPGNPCLDPNAHSLALAIPQILKPFTVTVQASEVSPSAANGICPNGATPSQDFDCRFVSFFTFQTLPNGDKLVPLCYPFANGNCVHYQIFSGTPGTEPDPTAYVGPVDWTISWNNDHFVPPAPYLGSTPRVYDDPDYAVSPTSPFGTNCNTPMVVGNPPVATNPPIFCQFEFDITTFFNPTKPVDATIGSRTKQFNDVVVAFPPANAGLVTATNTPDAATVTAGSPIGFTVAIANNSGGIALNGALADPLPAGTGVSWSISPAYTGPGTCAVTGAVGAQQLACNFGNIAVNSSFTIHVLSASSSVGTFASAATVTVTNQQVLAIASITVQAATAGFAALSPSQSVPAGTPVTLTGVVVSGNLFPAPGETVSVKINGVTQTAKIVANGAFSTTFPTATIPVSATPYVITYSYAGNAQLSPATNTSTTLTITSSGQTTFALTVSDIGTGTGRVTDNLQLINCVSTAGVQSGTCSANYPSGTVVTLTATPTSPTTFGGWSGACTGTAGCAVTLNGPQSVTASFVPPPQMIPVTFVPGNNATGMATYNCPGNPNPSPTNPCVQPNAHSLALAIPQILKPFTVTVQASEVPPTVADGICPNGATPSQDFDCRFASFFTYQTLPNGNKVVPLCYPYANGNCVHYQIFSGTPGNEPDPTAYVGPIDWTISWNNDHFTPPAPYLGSTPQVYDDPDYAVSPTSPFGTNCATPMLVGNPPVATQPAIFCQFEFNITTFFNATKPVDATIGSRTKQFNDVVVAFPPTNTGNLTVTTTTPSPTVALGAALNFTIAVSNSAGGPVTGATLTSALPAGTNVSWAISPAYTGPGTCAITGATGSQTLNCSFATINASQSFSISLHSAGSSPGTYTSAAVVKFGTQQILSIATIVEHAATSFSGLTPSQSVTAGTSVTLSGTVASGSLFPTAGELVSITINGVTQTATIGANGSFSAVVSTSAIPPSTTPYTITYNYVGDAQLSAATNASTTLTVSAATATLRSISLTPANPSIPQGTTQQFTATGTYSDGSTKTLTGLNWVSSQPLEASVTETGIATALAIGSPTISATLGGVTGSTTLTVTTNNPQISAKILAIGTQSNAFFVDLQLTNAGTGPANALTLTSMTFRTLTGTGIVTSNSHLSPALPDSLGSLAAGSSVTVRFYLNVPTTVVRFSINETGTLTTTSGQIFTFASGQAVFNN